LAGGVDDGVVVGVQPVRQEALLEIKPDALDRIEFGRIGRQGRQRDVGRHAQSARAVPARLIENHDDMLVLSDRRGEAIKERLHGLGVGMGHDQGKTVVGARFHAGKDVGEGEALVGEAGRALPACPPDMAGPALLPDARLVLEKQPDALVFMRTLNFSQQRRGSF